MTQLLNFPPLLSLMVSGADWTELEQADLLKQRWQELFDQIKPQLPHQTHTRLITGFRPGAEQNAVAFSHQRGFDIHLLLAHKFNDTPGLAEAEKRFNIDRIVSLGRADDEINLTPNPFAMRDRLTLDFADLLFIYWDAKCNNPENLASFKLISQAAQSRKPVVWMDPQANLHWLDLTALDDASLILLKAHDYSPIRLLTWFKPIFQLSDTPLKIYLKQLFDPTINPNDESAELLAELTQSQSQAKAFNDIGRLNDLFSSLLHGDGRGFLAGVKKRISEFSPSHLWLQEHTDIRPQPTLIEAFTRHDQLANKAGDLHRSNIWLLYGFAALAVVIAVSAEVWHLHWLAYAELAVIASIMYRVWWGRKVKLHDKWIRHRYLAEQMRYCIMGYPLMTIPAPFREPVWEVNNNKLELNSAELWLLQRHLITTGIPCEQGKVYTPPYHNHALVDHVRNLVQNQMAYHKQHHNDKHIGHHRLHFLAELSFLLTFIAVVAHLYIHDNWLLLFTAALPAVAAGIHGILTKLEMERISGQSAQLYQKLSHMDLALARFAQHADKGDDDWHLWVSLHYLANESEKTMSDNITQWQHLIQKQQTEIPA